MAAPASTTRTPRIADAGVDDFCAAKVRAVYPELRPMKAAGRAQRDHVVVATAEGSAFPTKRPRRHQEERRTP